MSGCRISHIAATAIALSLTRPAVGVFGVGDVVFDPTIHGWNILHENKELLHWAEQIKKFEDFVDRQIATIEQLSDMKNGLHSRIGDWYGVYERALTIRNRADNLKAIIGQNFSVTAVVDYGAPALLYSNNATFGPIYTRTAYGREFDFDDMRLKRYNSVFALHDDLLKSLEQANREIAELLGEVADTSREIVGATDQEKLSKLQEKKATLVLRLQELERQIDQKIQLLNTQATINRNRAELEREVKREQVKQTFREARERDAALADK